MVFTYVYVFRVQSYNFIPPKLYVNVFEIVFVSDTYGYGIRFRHNIKYEKQKSKKKTTTKIV